MKRIFHDYETCEEYSAGLWRPAATSKRSALIAAAYDLMGEPLRFADAMRHATTQWPRSCEYNLSNGAVNHQAWIGHAGTFLATGSPEETTRQAWRMLTAPAQDAANEAADLVLSEWREAHTMKSVQPSLFGLDGGWNA